MSKLTNALDRTRLEMDAHRKSAICIRAGGRSVEYMMNFDAAVEIVARLQLQVEALTDTLKDAPHGSRCASHSRYNFYPPCNCWKAK